MRKVYLRSKNLVLKVIITFLGFAMATAKCLAQYAAPEPYTLIKGTLKISEHTRSKFKVVVNNYDTIDVRYDNFYWKNHFEFYFEDYKYNPQIKEYKIHVFENSSSPKYIPFDTTVAIKPKERYEVIELTIPMKKKK